MNQDDKKSIKESIKSEKKKIKDTAKKIEYALQRKTPAPRAKS